MRERHLKRTNRQLFITHALATVFLMVGLVSQLNLGELAPIYSIVPLVLSILAFCGGIVVYFLYSDTVRYVRYVGISFSVVYLVMLLLSSGNAVFPYMCPFLIMFILSLDAVTVYIAGGVFLVANGISIIRLVAGAADPAAVIETVMIQAMITILVFAGCVRGVGLLIRFFDDSRREIMQVSRHNENIGKKIVYVAKGVEEHARTMHNQLDQIASSTEIVSRSMDDVSASAANSQEAVQQQTQRTEEIRAIIDDTCQKTNKIVDITNDTKEALSSGTTAMDKLFHHVKASIDASGSMKRSARQLQSKSDEVRGITDVILSISGSTNLLALNASIEAARAGDMGKGFSVVADEIRELAEQTREETENITALIDELSSEASAMTEQVEANVEIAREENEYANEANRRFGEITAKINDLANHISEVNQMMNSLLSSNSAIMESVSTLSATSEEISASTVAVLTTSQNNVALVRAFTESMERILEEIGSLREYTL